jgi:hypothetical protein
MMQKIKLISDEGSKTFEVSPLISQANRFLITTYCLLLLDKHNTLTPDFIVTPEDIEDVISSLGSIGINELKVRYTTLLEHGLTSCNFSRIWCKIQISKGFLEVEMISFCHPGTRRFHFLLNNLTRLSGIEFVVSESNDRIINAVTPMMRLKFERKRLVSVIDSRKQALGRV